ncbi:LysR family transcriptional regulator, partial [Mesorhizobium sp. M2D.F.Ca.ET.171.01.1.1]
MTTGEPDWNDLRFFLAAARAGTLSGAARALGVRHT